MFVQTILYVRMLCLADMTRQYKAMQNEMSLRIHQLESDLARTRTQLGILRVLYFTFIIFLIIITCFISATDWLF